MGNPEADSKSDYLSCLSFITSSYGHARTVASLGRNLTTGMLSGVGPEATVEAAEAAGFNARVINQNKCDEIPEALFPIILCLKDNRAFVLFEKNAQGYHVFDPEKHEKTTLDTATINADYDGRYIAFKLGKNLSDKSSVDTNNYSIDWFWAFFKDNLSLYKLAFLAAILINIFALTAPIFIMNMYDRVIPNAAIETGWVLAIGAMVVFSFDFIMRILRGRIIDIAGRRIDVMVGARIFDQLINMKLAERPSSSGVFASMLKEFDAVRDFFTSATLASFVDLPFALFFVLVIAIIGGPIALIPLGAIIIILVSSFVFQMSIKKDVMRAMKAGEERHGVLVETITGLETVKAIGADQRLRSLYIQHLGNAAKYNQHARGFANTGVSFANYIQQFMTVLIVVFGMYMIKEQTLSVGALIAVVLLSGRALAPMTQLASLLSRLYQTQTALQTVSALMHKDVDRPANKNFIQRETLKGAVSFDSVSFSYPQINKIALNEITFKINHGEKVAIIGRIGSGKSTLARLIMGLYAPDQGQILVDDSDQTQIDPADLRQNFAYISQDITLFRGTIRENITVAKTDATDEELLRAAKFSGVHDFVKRHPMGLDAPVGEGGSALSGGQRQAVALARAMLMNPSLYLCDEPTNAMDIQAENAFVQHVKGEVHDKTLLLITHRLSLLELVDRIIVLEQGQIIMDGPKEKVIKQLSGEQGGAGGQ